VLHRATGEVRVASSHRGIRVALNNRAGPCCIEQHWRSVLHRGKNGGSALHQATRGVHVASSKMGFVLGIQRAIACCLSPASDVVRHCGGDVTYTPPSKSIYAKCNCQTRGRASVDQHPRAPGKARTTVLSNAGRNPNGHLGILVDGARTIAVRTLQSIVPRPSMATVHSGVLTAAWTVATRFGTASAARILCFQSCSTRSPIHSCRRSRAFLFSSTEAQRIRCGGSNTVCILQAPDPCPHF
jgi:hypothetical protein